MRHRDSLALTAGLNESFEGLAAQFRLRKVVSIGYHLIGSCGKIRATESTGTGSFLGVPQIFVDSSWIVLEG